MSASLTSRPDITLTLALEVQPPLRGIAAGREGYRDISDRAAALLMWLTARSEHDHQHAAQHKATCRQTHRFLHVSDVDPAETMREAQPAHIMVAVSVRHMYRWEESYAARGGGTGGGVFLLERCRSSGLRSAMRSTSRDSVIVARATPS